MVRVIHFEPDPRVRSAQRAQEDIGTDDLDWHHVALNFDVNVNPCCSIADALLNVLDRTNVGMGDDAGGVLCLFVSTSPMRSSRC